ncbi:unnamed protein product [Urochloa humidicola]
MRVSNGDGGCVAAAGDDFKFAARRATGSGGVFVGGTACSVTAPAASARWRCLLPWTLARQGRPAATPLR